MARQELQQLSKATLVILPTSCTTTVSLNQQPLRWNEKKGGMDGGMVPSGKTNGDESKRQIVNQKRSMLLSV
jgi:hypothetical protein